MSYILDALKKSDQERQRTLGPALHSIPRPLSMGYQKGGLFWALVIFCIVLSTALVIIVWNLGYPKPIVSHLATDTVSNTTLESTTQSKNSEKPEMAEVYSKQSSEMLGNPLTAEQKVYTPSTSKVRSVNPDVVEFWELPDPVQHEIPALTFSFHVYSQNPNRRTIIINKRRVKAGDIIEKGLTLYEITETGVILHWKRFYFRINVVEQW